MPASKPTKQNTSGCAHKKYEFTDEAGRFCRDCGIVLLDIQSHFVSHTEEMRVESQKQCRKVRHSKIWPAAIADQPAGLQQN
ncbi:unnamed protein product [Calypogeia fissa]